MDESVLYHLKRRYAYDAWRDRNTLNENLFVWGLYLHENEFPNWQSNRIKRTDVSRLAISSERRGLSYSEWPTLIQSMWKRSEDPAGELLRLDVFECASQTVAHEFLVQFLLEFQLPLMERREHLGIGDVAFADPKDTAILFARANLVNLLGNAGKKIVSVIDIAKSLDRNLISKPEAERAHVIPQIELSSSTDVEVRVGNKVPINLEPAPLPALGAEAASTPTGRRTYKIFSPAGKVCQEQSHLVYRPVVIGPQEVTIFTMEPKGISSRKFQLVVS